MPAKQPNFTDLFSGNEFSKMFENYQSFPFDVESFMETQRKNIQALSEAQQIALDNMQAIVQRQTELVSQMVEDNSSVAKQLMSEGTPEEKIAQNADFFKAVYERNIKNMKEISAMLNKSGEEATNLINKRVSATMTEIKSALEKTQKKAA